MAPRVNMSTALPLLLLVACAAAAPRAVDETADMFMLATEWPQTACLMHSGGCSIADNVTTFTVHGLWPDNYNSDDPFYCDGESFDLDQLTDLLPLMHQLWPNVYADNTAYSFWQHEWDKHGTCAVSTGTYADQHAYFAAALSKVSRYNAFQILADAGIGPSEEPLDLNLITGALDEALAVRFNIDCQNINNKYYIYEVEICFDSEQNPVDCYLDDDGTTFRVSSCSRTEPVYYPPIVHTSNDDIADMFLLATEWPQTACLMHSGGCSIADNVTTFTVHGLWPDKYEGTDPSYCDGDSFDLDQLTDILPLMHQLWPNVYADNTAYSFWQHEWDKHGKCAVATGTYADQHAYFAAALSKVSRYNAFQILADAGIGPSEEPLDLNLVTSTLDEAFAVNFKINCQKIDNKFYIYEVEICFDSEQNPIDCYLDDGTTVRVSSCSHTEPIYYPPIVHTSNDDIADMFLLATEWPQTACLMHSGGCAIAENVTTFTVHGLWPDKYEGTDPSYCDGESFDLDQLTDILPLMHQLWPNVYADNTAYSFWQHEWDKHGKCAVATGTYADQHAYFAAALSKVSRYNAFQILADAGIGPSEEPLDLNLVTSTLDEAFAVNFKINCQKIDNKFYIYEVEICFDSEQNPIDCYLDDGTTVRVSSCSHTEPVYIPPIVHTSNDDIADMFLLATEWPQTACLMHSGGCAIAENVTTFTVHGLWPDKYEGTDPSYCDGESFDLDQLTDILPLMHQLWPNVYADNTAYSFWQHEWDKHGKCAVATGTYADQHAYFAAALSKVSRYNAFQILADAGIGPSDEPLDLNLVTGILDDAFAVTFKINCQKIDNKFYIYEVEICFDSEQNPIDCYLDDGTTVRVSSCSHTEPVYIPPIVHTY